LDIGLVIFFLDFYRFIHTFLIDLMIPYLFFFLLEKKKDNEKVEFEILIIFTIRADVAKWIKAVDVGVVLTGDGLLIQEGSSVKVTRIIA